jgi:hypothetical protein
LHFHRPPAPLTSPRKAGKNQVILAYPKEEIKRRAAALFPGEMLARPPHKML